MIKKILIYLAIAMVLTLLAMWVWQGGIYTVARYAAAIPNPINLTIDQTYDFRLPGQLDFPEVPDTTMGPDDASYGQYDYASEGDAIAQLQAEYDRLKIDVENARTFGDPSPYRGQVVLSRGQASESDPTKEYVVLTASTRYEGTISLAGWSIQSQLTGMRIGIPPAASSFVQGALNALQPIQLRNGERAIVTSGVSPVGASFRENVCTGYLAQYQDFEPTLLNACPNPKDAMPLSAYNIQTYGGECIDFLGTVPTCTFPQTLPNTISPACRSYVANTLSYNGCAMAFRLRVPFQLDTWRAYGNSPIELWRNSHDVIRLIDERGRTVDSLVY